MGLILDAAVRAGSIERMDPVIANPSTATSDPAHGAGRRWLRGDEGWRQNEDVARLAAAVGIALGAVALKVIIVGVLGGELGYLSYLGAVALGAWIAGSRGGAVATLICAVAQTLLFTRAPDQSVTPSAVFSLGLFLLDGAIVTILSSRVRRAYVRERTARTAGETDLELRSALHEAAERDRAALATLQTVTASLSGASTPTQVGDAILDRGMTALGAVAGGVSRVSDDGASVEVIAVRGYLDTEAGSTVPLHRPSHLAEAIDTGRPVLLRRPGVVGGAVSGQPAAGADRRSRGRGDRGPAAGRRVARARCHRLPVRRGQGLP